MKFYPQLSSGRCACTEKEPRILHWAPQYGSETGTGQAIKGWLEATAAAGLDVAVVSAPHTSATTAKHQTFSGPTLAAQLAVFRRQARSATIVHLHGAFDLKLSAAYVMLAFEKLRRIFTGEPLTIAFTPHGALSLQVFSRGSFKKRLYWNCVERLLTKLVNHAICTTPVEARNLQLLMPRVKIEVVPLVISRNELAAANPTETARKPPPAVPLLCTLGRYDIGMKGLDLLIGAVVKLNSECYPVRLRCIGYDRNHGTRVLEDYLRSVSAGEFVECTGPKFGIEKEMSLAACDVFCMPSRYESFSYALIEGLKSGLPVLVGSGACLTSYFDDEQQRTMVVAPELDAWCASIKRLLADPEKNRRSAERALENLGHICAPQNVGEALATVYRAMVARPANPARLGTTPSP